MLYKLIQNLKLLFIKIKLELRKNSIDKVSNSRQKCRILDSISSERLGVEYEQVLNDNLWDLYGRDNGNSKGK